MECSCMLIFQVSLTPIKDGTGFVTNFVAVLSDVTERKASKAAFQLRDHALSNLNEVSPDRFSAICGCMHAWICMLTKLQDQSPASDA